MGEEAEPMVAGLESVSSSESEGETCFAISSIDLQCPYGAPIRQKSLYRSPHSYFIFLFEGLPISLLFGQILSRQSPRSVLFCLILACYPKEYLRFELVCIFCQSHQMLSNHSPPSPSFTALFEGARFKASTHISCRGLRGGVEIFKRLVHACSKEYSHTAMSHNFSSISPYLSQEFMES